MQELIIIKIENKNVDILRKIFEGYDGLAVVSKGVGEGLIQITVTSDTHPEVMDILNHMHFDLEIIA